MKRFKDFVKEAEDINKQNVDKAIQHDWATHIYHPSLGEVKVDDHSLTEDGVIEEYYVTHDGKEYRFKAEDVKIINSESHGHAPKKKKKWMISVKVKYNESPHKALQKLKQLVSKEEVIATVKKKRYYMKPSVAKRLKSKEAEKQRNKDLQKEIQYLMHQEQQLWG